MSYFEHELEEPVQDELMGHALLLETFGPQLGRPKVDTLKGSSYTNMEELRFNVLSVFDPKRQAILLVAGDKRGANQKRFYKDLIRIADDRLKAHLRMQEVEEIDG